MTAQPCLPSRQAHHWIVDSPVPGVQFVLAKCKYCKRTNTYDKLIGEQTAFDAAHQFREKGKKQ